MGLPGAEAFRAGPALLATAPDAMPDAARYSDLVTRSPTTSPHPLPATPATVTRYLTALAEASAKVGTMSRRLSAIPFCTRCRTSRIRPATPG